MRRRLDRPHLRLFADQPGRRALAQAVQLRDDVAKNLDNLRTDKDAAQRLGITAGDNLIDHADTRRRERQGKNVRRAVLREEYRPEGRRDAVNIETVPLDEVLALADDEDAAEPRPASVSDTESGMLLTCSICGLMTSMRWPIQRL